MQPQSDGKLPQLQLTDADALSLARMDVFLARLRGGDNKISSEGDGLTDGQTDGRTAVLKDEEHE